MLTILAALAVSNQTTLYWTDRLTAGANSYYVSNRAPLAAQPFTPLPIGTIRPEGWLGTQLKLEVAGFVGHLEEISPYLEKKNNAWLAADGKGVHGWEETPYWLKGYGDLGYVLHDPKITKEAEFWIQGVLGSSRPDGWFGPESNRTANIDQTGDGPDMWPNMAMSFALQSYYDVSRDPRVIKLLTAYFKYQMALPDAKFYQAYWEHQRGGDNLYSVYWLYNRTGEKWLLDLADKIHRHTSDWTGGVTNYHGVNFAQGFREPAEYALRTGDPKQSVASEKDYDLMRGEFGQVPGGMYGADENARKGFGDPRQGTETCAMVEMMFSAEELLAISGDPRWAERCEDVAFNSLPASMTADEKALHYLTAPNMITIDAKNHAPDIQNGGKMLQFDPNDYRCCQHNVAMGWPYYAEHLWMATAHNGLAPVLYAPSTVTARVGEGSSVTIHEVTEYPFRERVRLTISCAKPVSFPLTLRIPSWTAAPQVWVNLKPIHMDGNHNYAIVTRKWRSGDEVLLNFPMEAELHQWDKNHDSVSIDRGPLTYSLAIGEKVVKDGGTAAWPGYDFLPTTPWNYGLAFTKWATIVDISMRGRARRQNFPYLWSRIEPHLKEIEMPMAYDEQPFVEGHAPVELRLPFRQIAAWQPDRLGMVGLLQQSPALSTAPVKDLTLVPMGAARLRIAQFPLTLNTVEGNGGERATAWTAPPAMQKPLPAQASHVFSGDTVEALSDGLVPKNSDDQSIPRFTWWDRKGSTEWVEYDLPSARKVSGTDVYWFDDSPSGGGCRVPQAWRVQVWRSGQWVTVDTAVVPGVLPNAYNSVRFGSVSAQKIRLSVDLQPGFSGGILQWKLRS